MTSHLPLCHDSIPKGDPRANRWVCLNLMGIFPENPHLPDLLGALLEDSGRLWEQILELAVWVGICFDRILAV